MAEEDEPAAREAVRYVADTLPGLIHTAQWGGLAFLTYLLTMALTEAQWRRRAFERADEEKPEPDAVVDP